ncbi:MAG TPA: hypothetical protein VN915_05705 [Elusimicrobiota bacterium]|nr:hypothetical protein [Elusimicrobiota bacterium]
MKLSLTPLTFVAALCAATASAQVTPIRFAAPVNPIAGLPKLLPSPMTGPLVGTGISLPNLVPALTPSVTLAALAPAAPAPVGLPAHQELIPAVQPARDPGVVNPLQRVMPGVVVRFAAPANGSANGAPSVPDAPKEKLDETFDGTGAPSKPAVNLPVRRPVSSGRHVSLPEWDLERELGI